MIDNITMYYIGTSLCVMKVTGDFVDGDFYDDDGFLVDEYLFDTEQEAIDCKIKELEADIRLLRSLNLNVVRDTKVKRKYNA